MLKFSFCAALLASAVTAEQVSSIVSYDLDTVDSEANLYEFEPVDYQLVKGVSNKKAYTYKFTPTTTLTGSYFFDFIVKYQWAKLTTD
jgi:hypothetical protein